MLGSILVVLRRLLVPLVDCGLEDAWWHPWGFEASVGHLSSTVIWGMLGGILVVLRRLLAPLIGCGLGDAWWHPGGFEALAGTSGRL